MNQIQKIFLMSAVMLTATTATIPAPAQLSSNAQVWVTGLNGPRGLKFGPNGSLYVAEAGTGGTISTAGRCGQVIPPVGPYKGGNTARISRIDSSGNRTTVSFRAPILRQCVRDLSRVSPISHSSTASSMRCWAAPVVRTAMFSRTRSSAWICRPAPRRSLPT